jgi:hypothetical protein
MNITRVLFTSILSLLTISNTLYGEKPKGSSLPIAKKQFELTYDEITEDIINILPDRMFIVDFDITEEGKVENARIVDDVNIDLSQTVISKVMALKFKPALQNGRPVRVRYKLPIVFK